MKVVILFKLKKITKLFRGGAGVISKNMVTYGYGRGDIFVGTNIVDDSKVTRFIFCGP
jgi:hypothetical protein